MALNPKILRKLMREVSELQKSPPDDIRICVPDEEGFNNLSAIIRGPDGTPFANGFFRVKFMFTAEFPQKPPAVYITTKIFHPNVSPSNGAVCVSTLAKDWVSTHTLTHVLVTIRCLLVAPNPDSALDEEAGRLLQEDYESYERRAKLITSVHATPRTAPKEFEATLASSSSKSKSDAPASSIPATKSAATSTILSSEARTEFPTISTQRASSPVAPATTLSSRKPLSSSSAKPMSNSSAKTAAIVDSKAPLSDNSLNLPITTTPLATADSNIAPPIKAKRAASATGIIGGEKRKKALKRL